MHVTARVEQWRDSAASVTSSAANFSLSAGGGFVIRREPLSVSFSLSSVPSDEALLHPFLALPAGVASRWLNRDAFHAGAFAGREGAWALLGGKGAGKSSLLGALSQSGTGIVTDDVLVVDDGLALPGPRSIDLRQGAADFLAAGRPLGRVGARDRWRLDVPDVALGIPLRGWIVPAWGEDLGLTPIRPAARIALLMTNLAVIMPPVEPARILEYAALPCWRLERPRDWSAMPAAVDMLLKL